MLELPHCFLHHHPCHRHPLRPHLHHHRIHPGILNRLVLRCTAWLHCCMTAWLHGCMVAWLQAWLHAIAWQFVMVTAWQGASGATEARLPLPTVQHSGVGVCIRRQMRYPSLGSARQRHAGVPDAPTPPHPTALQPHPPHPTPLPAQRHATCRYDASQVLPIFMIVRLCTDEQQVL